MCVLLGIDVPNKRDNDFENDENSKKESDSEYELNEGNNILDKNSKTVFELTIPYKQFVEFEPITVIYKKKKSKRAYNILKQNT